MRISDDDHDYLMDLAFEREDWDHYDQADGESCGIVESDRSGHSQTSDED